MKKVKIKATLKQLQNNSKSKILKNASKKAIKGGVGIMSDLDAV